MSQLHVEHCSNRCSESEQDDGSMYGPLIIHKVCMEQDDGRIYIASLGFENV